MKLLPLKLWIFGGKKVLGSRCMCLVCIPKSEKVKKKRAGCCIGSILLLYLKFFENYIESLLTKHKINQKTKIKQVSVHVTVKTSKPKRSTQRTQSFITAAERQNVLTEPLDGSNIWSIEHAYSATVDESVFLNHWDFHEPDLLKHVQSNIFFLI